MNKTKRSFVRKFLFSLFLIIAGYGVLLFLEKNTQQIELVINSEAEKRTEGPQWYLAERDDYSNLSWELRLVNYEYALPSSFRPEKLAKVSGGYKVDARIASAARQMIADAKKENVRIVVASAYRDYEYQENLYVNKVRRLKNQQSYSDAKAKEEAGTVVAYPGTSEHQLGLAMDLVDAGYQKLDESQENTAAYKWLLEHCHEYGFIVRYPNGKTDITGIIYEPWHFRYVGKEAAAYIMEQGICLEEYLWLICQ